MVSDLYAATACVRLMETLDIQRVYRYDPTGRYHVETLRGHFNTNMAQKHFWQGQVNFDLWCSHEDYETAIECARGRCSDDD